MLFLFACQTQILQHWNSFPRITYTQMKEFLEQEHGVTCSKGTMKWFIQSKFQGMEVLTIAELDTEEYRNFLKDEYRKSPSIPLHVLRMRLAYVFNKTASADTMLAFSMLRQRQRRRLRKKTPPAAAAVTHIPPHLDTLYKEIAENPSITVQGLSKLFVSNYVFFRRRAASGGDITPEATPRYF